MSILLKNNLSLIREELKKINQVYNELLYIYDLKTKEEAKVFSDVSEAKYRKSINPEVVSFLNELSDIEYNKTIGVFSKLLTAILNDVVSKDDTEEDKQKKIVLEAYTKANLPALDIDVDNMGKKENILDGNGGSIANIISAGLRLIALNRTNNRKFIVFDEADCWLKPTRVAPFANIINGIATKTKIQTLLISHHEASFFEDISTQILLKKYGDLIKTEIINGDKIHWDDVSTPGIRYIKLTNFMSHINTFIPLSNTVTVLTGDNDIGKSAVVAALKAVLYGESSDSYINHNASSCSVELLLENNVKIVWNRYKKSKKDIGKTEYLLYQNDMDVPKYVGNGNDIPEWITSYTQVSKIEKLDVQIGSQKKPIFLLDESPNLRAKILSLGKETTYLQRMIKENQEEIKKINKIISNGESQIVNIQKALSILVNIHDLSSEIMDISDKEIEYTDLLNDFEKSKYDLEKYITLDKKINILTDLEKDCSINKDDYLIEDTETFYDNIYNYVNLHKQLKIKEDILRCNELLDYREVQLHDLQLFNNFFNDFKKLSIKKDVNPIDINIDIPNLINTDMLENDILNIVYHYKKSKIELSTIIEKPELIESNKNDLLEYIELSKKIENLEEKEKDYNLLYTKKYEEITNFIKENPICPTCKSLMQVDNIIKHCHKE